jgi:biotin/methionine sulfoxide reductase
LTNYDAYPLTSFHWGTYRVEAREGEVVALHPFEEDSDPSPIGQGYVGVLNDPDRITAPMVRKSWLEGGPGAAGECRQAAFRATSEDMSVCWRLGLFRPLYSH